MYSALCMDLFIIHLSNILNKALKSSEQLFGNDMDPWKKGLEPLTLALNKRIGMLSKQDHIFIYAKTLKTDKNALKLALNEG